MKKILTYIVVLILLSAGCAQIGSLTGGEKDKLPPKMIKSVPLEKALNYSEKTIELKFDEFFVLKNLNAVFFSSPPFSEKPTFKIKRKTLKILIPEDLKDTTTYMFWFGDAIVDYHENNPIINFRFIFSTGNVLDTFEISGNLKDAYTLKPETDRYVMLYRENKDSLPISSMPYYICKTDTSGKFKLDYIKPGSYKIFALEDLDADLKFSLPNEKIAFLDTLIIPKIDVVTKIDSLKAGTVLHKDTASITGDTIKADTVIYTKTFQYSPKNIDLYMFKEDNNKQYLLNYERNLRGKCEFVFNKPTDSVIVKPINFLLNDSNFFIETPDTGYQFTYWLKEKKLYEKDTLIFSLSYFNKDSSENFIRETDTVQLFFSSKSEPDKKYLTFDEFASEQDSFINYKLISQTPIYSIDTSKIHLYEILDTIVSDPKKQELHRALRPAPDKIILNLKRPFVKTANIEPLNFDTLSNWSNFEYYNENKEIWYQLNDKKISEKDTLKFVFHYDNDFFKNQIQQFNDTLALPLLKQGLLTVDRKHADTIIFKFKKKITKETQFLIPDKTIANWYKFVNTSDSDKVILKLTNSDLIYKDTLMITVKTTDYDNTKGDKIEFEYSKNAVFKFDKQRIIKSERPEPNRLNIIFNKPIISDVEIKSINFGLDYEWYNKTLSKSKDTVYFEIIDRFVSNLDTVQLNVTYKRLNRFDKTEDKTDTINFIYKRQKRISKRTAQKNTAVETDKIKTEPVSIDIPVEAIIKKDSLSERKYNLVYNWKAGKIYKLKMDSTAFTDIYGICSKNEEVKINVRKAESYGSLAIKISGINYINKPGLSTDSLLSDSIVNSVLKQGQLKLMLFNDKNEIVSTAYTKTDSVLTISNLPVGDYTAKIHYDINENDQWDSGDYLKHKQAEIIKFYSEAITISGKSEKNITWSFKP